MRKVSSVRMVRKQIDRTFENDKRTENKRPKENGKLSKLCRKRNGTEVSIRVDSELFLQRTHTYVRGTIFFLSADFLKKEV